jgi:EAL domain-containing protein (putative c-di-GMP-specific phosphodiesterase class I)/GGDEF domain-containing protein
VGKRKSDTSDLPYQRYVSGNWSGSYLRRIGAILIVLLHAGSFAFFFFDPLRHSIVGIPEILSGELLLLLPATAPCSPLLLLPPVAGGVVSFLLLGGFTFLSYRYILGHLVFPYEERMLLILVVFSIFTTLLLFVSLYRFRRKAGHLLARSYRNPVSGLPNRYKLLEDIRKSGVPALALLKAERYTEINSCFGYRFGEKYIINIQDIIETTINQTLSTVRLYHVDRDTFAILEEYASFDRDDATFQNRFSEIIHILREQTFSIGGLRFPVPVTAGISVGSSEDPILLYNQAEQALTAALYTAKSEMMYAESQYVKDDIVSHTNTLAMVSHAIQSDMVEVQFQPIVKSRGSVVAMYEALVRIRNEEGKLIPPGSFLYTAKLSSYHKELTMIVFRKTFKRLRSVDAQFTVNISMENITDEDFLPFLRELMEEYPRCRNRCVLEITESEGVENYDEVCEFISSVRSLGYKIAIDDFGSGYSNFSNIIRLSVDYIKFDGALVQRMKEDTRAVAVLEKMNEIAHELNVATIAEFIDSQDLLSLARRIKIDFCQGFLLGRPSGRLVRKVKG